jgi:orotidine-5'-phosphate decarboxylase
MEQYPVIVALDRLSRERALEIARELSGKVWGFKVHDLFIRYGPEIIWLLKPFGKVFLDMKYHDIPTTVAAEVRASVHHGADLISVHAEGGVPMLRAAVSEGGTRVVAITELTSAYNPTKIRGHAERAHMAGVTYVTGAAQDIATIKDVEQTLKIITPGIREQGGPVHDQVRTATAHEALAAGADLLVIGRPITESPDPRTALEKIMQQ